jgi:predicted secreted protein
MKATKTILYVPALLLAMSCFCISHAEFEGKMEDNSATITVTEEDSEVELYCGDMLIVRLAVRPGTGYSWQIVENDPELLSPQGEPEFESESGEPGGTEYQVFRFRAEEEGDVLLELHYVRSWEEEEEPEKIYSLEVKILEGS